ncbi:molybdate ABC transporter substrate-binding protein [Nocardioides gansuensis]|uniref:molybdate ABC transporter substrate-binding protein n=1 Tax=Nocardioides gansuensis TaxID=2138300 RepID=UPI001BAA2462|nr:molybdate ABC transporter substrate-binding protein [Nocardioides gansuensis]
MRLLAALALVLPLAACGGGDQGKGDAGQLTVLAAASLTGTFTELAEEFEDRHPGVEVELAFGSSTTLAQQVAEGAPGDVLATADLAAMDLAGDAVDTDATVRGFVRNALVLVTPPDDPAGIDGLDDLAGEDVDYVVCVDTAPCGRVAAAVLAEAGVTTDPASEEVDVKAVLARVTAGEADAGLVYATDAVAAGDAVRRVDLPELAAATTDYAIAPLADGDSDLAADFLDLIASDEGRGVLEDAGFVVP